MPPASSDGKISYAEAGSMISILRLHRTVSGVSPASSDGKISYAQAGSMISI